MSEKPKRRPAGKLSVKAKGGTGKKIAVFALWPKDNGGLSASFDLGKNGDTKIELYVNGDRVTLGKDGTHYCDLYFADDYVPGPRDVEPRENGSSRSVPRDPAPTPPAEDDPSWPTDGDIPF